MVNRAFSLKVPLRTVLPFSTKTKLLIEARWAFPFFLPDVTRKCLNLIVSRGREISSYVQVKAQVDR